MDTHNNIRFLLEKVEKKVEQAYALFKIASEVKTTAGSEILIRKAPCPVGTDEHQFFLICKDGGILFAHCDAECSWRDICKVLSIDPSDFFIKPFWKVKRNTKNMRRTSK